MFKKVSEAIYWIEHIKRKSRRNNLDRMNKMLEILNHPELSYKKIHIAGTNGKGATCEIAASILIEKGYKVGRFISPYILQFNERIVVNHKEISDYNLLKITNYIYPIIQKYNSEYNDIVPFFEVVTLIGFLYFKEMNIDILCIECGLGGLLDSTNVINADCSIITSIGYDHMNVLGNTLPEIANQKLGIVKENNHLITGVSKNLYKQFDSYCKSKNATINKISIDDLNIVSTFDNTLFSYKDNNYKINLIGKFEALNAILAIEAVKYIDNSIDNALINRALNNIFWPGRLEIISRKPLVILDGGHNISAINVIVDSLKSIDLNKKYTIIYTALSDKETDKVVLKLSEIASNFIITTIEDPRAKDPNIILNEIKIKNKKLILNEFEAFKYAYSKLNSNDNLLIIGSIHFISSLRPFIIKMLK